MITMPVKLYAHLSWTTDGRLPMIGLSEEEFLRRFLPVEAGRHGVKVTALGIVADHLHLIVCLPSVINVPVLVQSLKGASARIANKDPTISRKGIKWAKGYDLRSVSPGNLSRAVEYVRHQAERHPARAIRSGTLSLD